MTKKNAEKLAGEVIPLLRHMFGEGINFDFYSISTAAAHWNAVWQMKIPENSTLRYRRKDGTIQIVSFQRLSLGRVRIQGL